MRHKLCRSFPPWCPGVKNRCLCEECWVGNGHRGRRRVVSSHSIRRIPEMQLLVPAPIICLWCGTPHIYDVRIFLHCVHVVYIRNDTIRALPLQGRPTLAHLRINYQDQDQDEWQVVFPVVNTSNSAVDGWTHLGKKKKKKKDIFFN